jgi:hypothetical protein
LAGGELLVDRLQLELERALRIELHAAIDAALGEAQRSGRRSENGMYDFLK